MSRIGSDEELRNAVHDAVGDVTAGFDLMERVRGGVVRRRRRVRAAGSMAAVVALAAGVSVVAERRGSDSAIPEVTGTTGGVAAPDCSGVLAPSAEPAMSDPRADGKRIVPGTPVVAVVCPIIMDTRPLPSKPAIDSLGRPQVLRGDRLKQVVDALDTAEMGSLYDHSGPPSNAVSVVELVVIFRYASGGDTSVNVPLYNSRVAIIEGPSDLQAHFWPKPIPDVLKELGADSGGS